MGRIRNSICAFRTLFRIYRGNGYRVRYLDDLIMASGTLHNPRRVDFVELGKQNDGVPIAIIRLPQWWIPTAGFYALMTKTLLGLYAADKLCLTPVVDNWSGCPYEEDKRVHGTNIVFEYYFEPVSKVSLTSALDSKSVAILSEESLDLGFVDFRTEWFRPNDDLVNAFAECYRKYIHLNKIVKAQIEKAIQKRLDGKKTLGVHFRGTDYSINADSHPVALTIEDYFDEIDYAMKKMNFDQIFLATDDLNALKKFRERYKKVSFYPDAMRATGDKSVAFIHHDEVKLSHYRAGFEVIRDCLTLAACDGFIGSLSQVSLHVRINRKSTGKDFEYIKVLEKGINHNNKNWIDIYNKQIKNAEKS